MHGWRARLSVAVAAGLVAFSLTAQDQAPTPQTSSPFTYEFYYTVKWGYLEEFLELYKKNHLPILRTQQERGEILSISAAYPINHASESERWDLRITIVYRDAIAAL